MVFVDVAFEMSVFRAGSELFGKWI
uniref:Uncharacterized protein n=1 Tax=Rhizophora mucronata TaxID=61149 RepID=A0A2P2IJA7_RHIMU